MKRLFSFLAALSLAAALTACGTSASGSESASDSIPMSSVPASSAPADSAASTVRADYAAAYAERVRELAAENENLRFALIQLDGDDTPELVADNTGFSVSVYTFADGEVVALMEQWPYGAAGNNGYEYLPAQNVIRNYNYDMAGAIVYETYYSVGADHALHETYDDMMSAWYFEDKNGNGIMDEDEPYSEDPLTFYFGETAVTAEVYAARQIPGDYEYITGTATEEEILKQLEG